MFLYILLALLGTVLLIALVCVLLIYLHMRNPIDVYTAEGITKVACVGDSTTFGMMIRKRLNNCYPACLQNKLGSGFKVLNFGMCGHTAMKSGDKPVWNHKYFKVSTEFEPDIVILMLGSNDAKYHNYKALSDYLEDLNALVQHYHTLPSQPAILLASPPMAYKNKIEINPDYIAEMQGGVKNMAENLNIPYIYIYSLTLNHAEWFSDGIHPNATGAEKIAQAMFSSLIQSLN